MRQKSLMNLLTLLPILLVVSFSIGMWQTGGKLLQSWTDLKFSNWLTVSEAQAQSTCTEYPTKSLLGEGRMYYDSCREAFMMSKNNGDWEELGGGLWKNYTTAEEGLNSIYNTNTASVYVNKDLIVGVSKWGRDASNPELVSLDAGENLIYGLANYGLDGIVNTYNLLMLETYSPVAGSPGEGVPTTRFVVTRDGKVTIGGGGKLIVPEICMPDESNCLTSLGSGTGAAAGSEIYWEGESLNGNVADPTKTPLIRNSNLISDAVHPDVGGNVHISRDLSINGDLTIGTHKLDAAIWQPMDIASIQDNSSINSVWFDFYTSFNRTSSTIDSMDVSNTVSTNSHTVFYAVTKTGSFIRYRPVAESSYTPLTTSDGTPYIKTLAPGVSLNGVCSTGNGDGIYKHFRVFVVGDDGAFHQYLYIKSLGKWDWVSQNTIGDIYILNGQTPHPLDIYGIWCKSTGTSYASSVKTEVMVVGQYGFIGKYYCQDQSSTCTYTQLRAPNISYPDLKSVWGDRLNYDAISRYYAVGNANKTAGSNTIYTWTGNNLSPIAINLTTNKDFNTVAGKIPALGGSVTTNWLFVGGESGALYRGKTDSTLSSQFTNINSGDSTVYDINSLLVGDYIVVAGLGIKKDSNGLEIKNPVPPTKSLLTYFHIKPDGNINTDYANTSVDSWSSLSASYQIKPRTSVNTVSGIASTYRSVDRLENRFTLRVGTFSGETFNHNNIWASESINCTTTPSGFCQSLSIEPGEWKMYSSAGGKNLRDIWHVTDPVPDSITASETFVVGEGGIMSGNNLSSFGVRDTTLPVNSIKDIRSISGTGNDFIAAVGNYIENGTKKAVLLTRQPVTSSGVDYSSTFTNPIGCVFTATSNGFDDFAAVWTVKRGTNYEAYMVGGSGKMYKYSTGSIGAWGSCAVVTGPAVTKDLTGIAGVRNAANTGYDIYVTGKEGVAYKGSLSNAGALGSWDDLTDTVVPNGVSVGTGNLNNVYAFSNTEIYFLGEKESSVQIWKGNGFSWSRESISDNTTETLAKGSSFFDAWKASANSTVYFAASGGYVFSKNSSSIWTAEQVGGGDNFLSIDGINLSTGYALATVGTGGLARKYTSTAGAFSGDLISPSNRWGPSGDTVNNGDRYPAPISGWFTCLKEGEYVIGLQFASGAVTGVRCRRL